MEHLKLIFYSFIWALLFGGYLYWDGSPLFRTDRLPLYFVFALSAISFFYQTYLLIYDVFHRRVTATQIYSLIYDVWHRGVTATPDTAEKTTAVTENSEGQTVEKKEIPRWKVVFYSFITLLVLGDLLYLFRGQDLGDTILLYFIAALIALVFFVQSYSLIYDVWHRGVTAALNPAEKTTDVTDKSDLRKVEKKEMPRWKNIFYSFIAVLVSGFFLYYYKPVQRDTFWLYVIGFFILMVIFFFVQTYLLIYDVFHRGVTAALIATDKTADVTEKSEPQKVEANEMQTQPDGAGR